MPARRLVKGDWRPSAKNLLVLVVVVQLVVIGALVAIGLGLRNTYAQRCEDRREAREGIRELVIFAVGEQPRPDESQRVTDIRALVAPGGKLAPIDC